MDDMKLLWAVMKSMYPHAFKEYGLVGKPVWRYWCAQLKGGDIARGIAVLEKRTSHFPPSLPEFKQMCGMIYAIPENDEDMRRWAIENGLGDARGRESWKQYRARLEAEVDRRIQANALQLKNPHGAGNPLGLEDQRG